MTPEEQSRHERLAEFANEMMEDKSYWLNRCIRRELQLRWAITAGIVGWLSLIGLIALVSA